MNTALALRASLNPKRIKKPEIKASGFLASRFAVLCFWIRMEFGYPASEQVPNRGILLEE